MSRGGRGLAGPLASDSGLVIVDNGMPDTARCTPCHNQHLVPNYRHGCALQVAGSTGHACRAREDPGGAPAAQTPSALGRPARSAACRSSAGGGG
eukprot:scaffold9145_cov62-Phaeocystis_antarctica.AAC.6